ncbi:hypothetical protein [Micromonospora sp. NPDC050495]|uniref:hypothetical protein n=1 Tax=Micromonospora sp. NPDC050495 TaxID=3154936 RepID=UPI0033CE4D8A
MRRTIRRIGFTTAVAAVLAWAPGSGARAAAADPYPAAALCGPGFTAVDQDPIHDAAGRLLGTVHLLHNPFTGYGCAVTLKTAYAGMLTRTQVYLDPEATTPVVDDGHRLWAAGPVHGYVRGGCAIWGGAMTDPAGVLHRHDRANPAIGGAVTCF